MDTAPILFCYDDSSDAKRAIDAAALLFPHRRAVVLDVAPLVTVAESYASLSALSPNFEEVNLADAQARADTGAGHARAAGFDAEAQADLGSPTWEGILEVADEHDAAVIVIGSRGLSGVREVFEGSLSHELARHADRPVLIVPPVRRDSAR